MRALRTTGRRAFTLVELLVSLAVIALLVAILLPALSEARRAGRMAVCQSNLRQFATATGTYAVDFKDWIWSFNWSRPTCPSDFADLRNASSNVEATSNQAVDIIRRNSPIEPNFPRTGGWIPSVEFSHLVLLDYLARRLPEPICACPEDANLRDWQRDIAGFNAGAFGPNQPSPVGVFRAKPYSCTYEVNPAAYDANLTPTTRIHQAEWQYGYYVYTNSRFGGLLLSSVSYPAQKVHMSDTHQRHFRRPLFYALRSARQPILHFDASVVVRRTSDANRGWDPWIPAANQATIFWYRPYTYDPPTSDGTNQELVTGFYRWTRAGINGVDFGGREVNTGQPMTP